MNPIIDEKTELEERITKGSDKVDDYFNLGKLYLDNCQYAELLKIYDHLEKLSLSENEFARLYYEKGEALESLNRVEEAIGSYRKSLQHISSKDDSDRSLFLKGLNHYNLFLLLVDPDDGQRHGKEAIKAFNIILERYPNFEDKYALYSYLGDTLGRLGEYKDALSFYSHALELSSDTAERVGALTGLGTIHGLEKKVKKAEKYFNKALQEANESIPTSKIHYQKGKMFFGSNYFSEANRELQAALEHVNNDPRLRNNQEYEIDMLWHLGTIAYELKKDETVKTHLNKVLELADKTHYYYANSNLTLGHVYLFEEDYFRAREHYNNVLLAPRAFEEERDMAKKCLAQIPLDS